MKNFIRKAFSVNEVKLAVIFVIIVICFSIINPNCLTVANLYSLLSATAVMAIYSLAIMLVMCSGSIDASCAVIGSFGAYCSIYYASQWGLDPSPIVLFITSIVISLVLELINWFMVGFLKFDSYIATTGTASMLKGAVLVCVSTSYVYSLPSKIGALGVTELARATYSNGIEAPIYISVLFMFIFYIIMHVVMTYTNFGRQVYAVGADPEAATRAGINVRRIRLIVFLVCGVICGCAGILRDSCAKYSFPNPSDVVGKENLGIASVILGTANNSKARGSVVGTLLGILMIKFIETNLVMIGISTYWAALATGLIMYIGLVGQTSNRKITLFSKKEAK